MKIHESKIRNQFALSMSRRRAFKTGAVGLAAASLGMAGLRKTVSASPSLALQADGDNVDLALSELDTIVADAQERTGVPGIAVGVVRNDEVVYLKGFGVREAGLSPRVTADTVFQLASLSKPIASTVVAGLVGDEVVSWDSRLGDLFPAFEMYEPWVTRNVTIRDMFSHRSGLPDHAGDLLEDIGYDRAEVLHRLRYQRPATSMRSAYKYTNFGLTAAAEAAAMAAGMSWEDLSAERLYNRIGLQSTSSRYQDFIDSNRRAAGHVLVDGTWVARYQRDPDAQSPAGGVSSSIRDVMTWLRLQLGNGTIDGEDVISAAALAETHRPQIVSNPAADPFENFAGFYGLGWNVSYESNGLVRLSHSGAFALGAATAVFLLPSHQLGMAVLTNGMPIGVPEAIEASFLDLVQTGAIQNDYITLLGEIFAVIMAPPYQSNYDSPPQPPSPALEASAYTGIYANDLYGEIEIADQGGELALYLGPNRQEHAMQHYDHDVYLYQPTGENAGGLSAMTFEMAPDRRASSVAIQIFNVEGQGVFYRVE